MVSILSKDQQAECPEPYKKKYDSLEEAENRLDEILQRRAIDEEYRLSHADKPEVPCRVYFCPCGYYHLTARHRSRDMYPAIVKQPWPDCMRPTTRKETRK